MTTTVRYIVNVERKELWQQVHTSGDTSICCERCICSRRARCCSACCRARAGSYSEPHCNARQRSRGSGEPGDTGDCTEYALPGPAPDDPPDPPTPLGLGLEPPGLLPTTSYCIKLCLIALIIAFFSFFPCNNNQILVSSLSKWIRRISGRMWEALTEN